VVVGTLVGLNDAGEPLVVHPLDPSGRAVLARSTVRIDPSQVDQEVVVAFDKGDLREPIVMGVLWRPGDSSVSSQSPRQTVNRQPIKAELDGDQLVFTAEKEIVLRCGKASITLTRAGKILIRGAYLLSRSSGVHRIKGGSVQIN
jgi:hypothetical protein